MRSRANSSAWLRSRLLEDQLSGRAMRSEIRKLACAVRDALCPGLLVGGNKRQMIRRLIHEPSHDEAKRAGEHRLMAIDLGLVEAKDKWPEEGREFAQPGYAGPADLIGFRRAEVGVHGVGWSQAKGGEILGFKRMGGKPVQAGAPRTNARLKGWKA